MLWLSVVLTPAQVLAASLNFISIDVEPWATEKNGEMSGGFIELVKEISARTGYSIDISLTPFARVDRELETGGHDCTILIPRSEETVVPGELVSYHEMGLIARPGVEINSYEDLTGLKISLIRGSSITTRFDSDQSLNKVYDTDYLIALRKLARGRIDAIAGAIPTVRYLAVHNRLSAAIGETLALADIPLIFQCSRKSSQLPQMEKINQAIRAMKQDGTIEKIRQQYYF
ncbi:substrate-binding periplasmic protein [Gilvimarinus sp. 1_MG-2023]|uniref:substrate-binding periplasmic protein n=1 Tax=Gilvimarinus sp. 1_MG-2023 TaxID=3062638 RepID=UPI0026E29130|nr:transporter substrate-binding domain-containing protein [Gilvimarinus sp. 1_MG-2023]MDO6748389.1 transporter substrate-binding domain-containing protein [Gilvimarinus sp. 1_MG-2023]